MSTWPTGASTSSTSRRSPTAAPSRPWPAAGTSRRTPPRSLRREEGSPARSGSWSPSAPSAWRSGGSVWPIQTLAYTSGSCTSEQIAQASQPVSAHHSPTLGEMPRTLADHLATDRVALDLGVAIDVGAVGGDHERRVGDDQIEALPRDRGQEVPQAALHRRDRVERRVEGGEGDGPGVAVGGDDRVAVGSGEQRLDAAAGAEVEGAAAVPAHGELREGDRA